MNVPDVGTSQTHVTELGAAAGRLAPPPGHVAAVARQRRKPSLERACSCQTLWGRSTRWSVMFFYPPFPNGYPGCREEVIKGLFRFVQ